MLRKNDYCILRFHADSSPGLITDKSSQSENEVYPSEEQETIGAKYYLSTGKDLPFCRKCPKYVFVALFQKMSEWDFNDAPRTRPIVSDRVFVGAHNQLFNRSQNRYLTDFLHTIYSHRLFCTTCRLHRISVLILVVVGYMFHLQTFCHVTADYRKWAEILKVCCYSSNL